MTTIARRLIICVDGTWFDPDGGSTKRRNITNIYRLYASVKETAEGDYVSVDGRQYSQQKIYVPGIGSGDNVSKPEKYYTGIFGLESFDQIKNIYRICCRLKNPGDEVWLYGFSRGAYVVRAVAGLLHYMEALVSADSEDGKAFDSDYKETLKIYEQMQKSSGQPNGNIHYRFTAKTRQAPIIKFVGAFDTVKAVDDKSLHDITFNDSVQHMRAALALNEERSTMKAELVWPPWAGQTRLGDRSFVQAWFVGTHRDMGGSAEKDGLALYPLQWMIIESQDKGLAFEFSGNHGGRAPLQNPLRIIGLLHGHESPKWSCTTKNGITVVMRDIREVHTEGSIFGNRYEIQLKPARGLLASIKRPRRPFEGEEKLEGYCSFGPHGTIIHPSVYLVIDRELNRSINKKFFRFYDQLEQHRHTMLGDLHGYQNQGFWNDGEEMVIPDELPAIRVLVCGNAGVGKSKLINKIFGVEVTSSNDHKRGEHNVDEEIRWPGREDLVVHDSRGFEAGGIAEFNMLEDFLQRRSMEADLSERIHIIWVCVEASTCRTIQASTEKLFESIAQYAEGIPVVVIATKMDEFLAIAELEVKRDSRQQGKTLSLDDMEQYAQQKLAAQLSRMEELLSSIGAQFDACVATSMCKFMPTTLSACNNRIAEDKADDQESIDNLHATTKNSFTSERVRFLYIRAQQREIYSKIDYAVSETMKVYKKLLGSATAMAGVPGAPTSTRTGGAITICQTVLACFGNPPISPETALEICKANVWDDMANNIIVAIAEGCSALGILATVATGMPFFLIPMATNILGIVRATMRLTLILACDMILIMTMACTKASMKCLVQPEKRDVEVAARAYRAYYKSVHQCVKKKAIPNVVQAFQVGKVGLGFQKVIDEYQNKVVERNISPRAGRYSQHHKLSFDTVQSLGSASTEVESDSEDIKTIIEGRNKLDG